MAILKLNNLDEETAAWLHKKATELSTKSKKTIKTISKNQFAELLLKKCMLDDLTHLTIADQQVTMLNEKMDMVIDVVKMLADLFLYEGGDEVV